MEDIQLIGLRFWFTTENFHVERKIMKIARLKETKKDMW